MNLKKYRLFLLLIVIIIIGIGIYFLNVYNNRFKIFIRPHVYIEYGNPVTNQDIFVTDLEEEFQFSKPLEQIKDVGTYSMAVVIQNKEMAFEIHIIDSTEPKLEVEPLTIFLDEPLPKTEDFVKTCEDLSHCSYVPISLTQ